MLLINIHKLDIILAHPICLVVLEHQIDYIRRVFRLECEDILILRGSQYFGEGCEVDSERDVAVTAVGREGVCSEHHGDEGDVGVVHSLECNAGVIAVEVAVLHEVFDGINHLYIALVFYQSYGAGYVIPS